MDSHHSFQYETAVNCIKMCFFYNMFPLEPKENDSSPCEMLPYVWRVLAIWNLAPSIFKKMKSIPSLKSISRKFAIVKDTITSWSMADSRPIILTDYKFWFQLTNFCDVSDCFYIWIIYIYIFYLLEKVKIYNQLDSNYSL